MTIASSWIDGAEAKTGGGSHQVINPATASVVAEYALATPDDVDKAVASARSALPQWSTATPVERATVLAKLAKLAGENAEALVAEEVSQTGKPVRLATEFDVPGSVDNIDFFAGAARHLEGKATAEYSADHTSSIRREAIGVVATITPWNYPLQMAVWKVLPALAAGCAVVIKPAEVTPLTTLTLARLASEAGLLHVAIPGIPQIGSLAIPNAGFQMQPGSPGTAQPPPRLDEHRQEILAWLAMENAS